MLEVSHISRSFGAARAVSDLSFSIGKGEVVALLGPNGAGKTTTIRMVTGFLPPDSGTVSIGGFDIADDSLAARRLLGYLPENAPLYPEMQVRRYLSFRAALAGVTGAAARDAIDREMARCDLTTVATKRISALSKGFRQRVGLAAALVHDPKVVILDEPSNGLDPSQILQFRSLIATLARERTMLISSHILSEVQKICSRVIIIAGGTLRADSTPDAIARRARGIRTFTVAFDINDYAAARDLLRAIPDVRDVTPISHPAESRFEVTSDALDLRHRIARAAHDRNLLVIELAETAPSLEQAFMQLVTQEARA